MDLTINFGALGENSNFVIKVQALQNNLEKFQNVLSEVFEVKNKYEDLTTEQRAEIDIFLLYAFNCLHWFQLRMQGLEPNNHTIKNEIARVREVMKRLKDVKERHTIRPKLNIEAAKRFVRSGLWEPNQTSSEPPNKKIKFTEG